jgi:hypothetical protein
VSGETSGVSPFDQAIEVIKKLLDLCAQNGLGREAKAIAAGMALPGPLRRGPGAPSKKGRDFQKLLAVHLAIKSDGESATRGLKAALARTLAENELKSENGGHRTTKAERKQLAATFANDISKIPPQYLLISTFLTRRTLRGESLEAAEQIINDLTNGDKTAEAVFLNEVNDLVDLFRKAKRLSPKS